MNDSGGMGIVGVIIGAVLVMGVIFFAFGDRLGMRSPSVRSAEGAGHEVNPLATAAPPAFGAGFFYAKSPAEPP